MFAAMPWTTIATGEHDEQRVALVRSATATNGFVSPVAAAAQPPTNGRDRRRPSVAEANSPIRMSRRVGV